MVFLEFLVLLLEVLKHDISFSSLFFTQSEAELWKLSAPHALLSRCGKLQKNNINSKMLSLINSVDN